MTDNFVIAQQAIISQRLRQINKKISSLENQVYQAKQKLDPTIGEHLVFWRNRLTQFPDNPHIQAKVEEYQKQFWAQEDTYLPIEEELSEAQAQRNRLYETLESIVPK